MLLDTLFSSKYIFIGAFYSIRVLGERVARCGKAVWNAFRCYLLDSVTWTFLLCDTECSGMESKWPCLFSEYYSSQETYYII